jgi:hypothetical protein
VAYAVKVITVLRLQLLPLNLNVEVLVYFVHLVLHRHNRYTKDIIVLTTLIMKLEHMKDAANQDFSVMEMEPKHFVVKDILATDSETLKIHVLVYVPQVTYAKYNNI